MRTLRRTSLVAAFALAATAASPPVIREVRRMPDVPLPLVVPDWKRRAADFDRLAFDPDATGQYLPLLHLTRDATGTVTAFGIPTYVGDGRQAADGGWEAVATMGAVWGGTLAGIDKAHGHPCDYVRLCRQFYDPRLKMMGNNVGHANPDGTFWYTLFPNVIAAAVSDRYPDEAELADMVRSAADQWSRAAAALDGGGGAADFDHTGFSFATMRGVDNGKWKEPDAGAGVAWLELTAYDRWHDPSHLAAADRALKYLDRRPADRNPSYEVLMPFGALAAVRMNAEWGRLYDTAKMVNWCFDPGVARPDWKVNAEPWGGVHTEGLVGATDCPPWRTQPGGYGFAMNTFAWAWPLVPVARYDPRFAADLGRWMLNAAGAARLYYADARGRSDQTCPDWAGDPRHAIPYEGLKFRWDDPKQPLLAAGDPVHEHWGPKTDFALYGGAYAGVYAALIDRTDQEQILRLDLLATDVCHPPADPSYLYYNPYGQARTVSLTVGPRACDVYDAVGGSFLVRGATGTAAVTIPAHGATVAVVVPAGGKLSYDAGHTLVDGVVVDYRRGGEGR